MYEDVLAGKIKAQQESQNYTQANFQTQGVAGLAGDIQAKRPGLQERIGNQLQRARQEGRKAARLHELSELLAKHPDVARILDLLEETSG